MLFIFKDLKAYIKIKLINSQIGIFLTDDLMNPSKLIENIAVPFDNIFNKKIFNLVLEEMLLLRYSSYECNCKCDYVFKFFLFFNTFKKLLPPSTIVYIARIFLHLFTFIILLRRKQLLIYS